MRGGFGPAHAATGRGSCLRHASRKTAAEGYQRIDEADASVGTNCQKVCIGWEG